MYSSENASQIDKILLPFLQSVDDEQSEDLLIHLVSEQAEPLIKNIVNNKLRVSFKNANYFCSNPEVEDVCSDVIVQLIIQLQDLKASQNYHISDFLGYVAVMAYNKCYEFLRQKYPLRWQLKSRLRYLLNSRSQFDLWEQSTREWVCGFVDWKTQKKSTDTKKLRQLCNSPELFERTILLNENINKLNLEDLVGRILRWVDTPIELDELVNILVYLFKIKDETSTAQHTPVSRSSNITEEAVNSGIDQRVYLQKLWTEICQLPPRQRFALLLNLKDSRGADVLSFLPLIGIASVRQIATVIGMSAIEFAKLWNQIPLDDEAIAQHLGMTRQQVINLRKSARERLARRMKKIDD